MGVDLVWKDEDGNELGEVGDPRMLLSSHIQSSGWDGTSCLRFIDPWGDTVFNQFQIAVVAMELEESLGEVRENEVREHVSRVIGLLRQANGQLHTYAWFVGD